MLKIATSINFLYTNLLSNLGTYERVLVTFIIVLTYIIIPKEKKKRKFKPSEDNVWNLKSSRYGSSCPFLRFISILFFDQARYKYVKVKYRTQF